MLKCQDFSKLNYKSCALLHGGSEAPVFVLGLPRADRQAARAIAWQQQTVRQKAGNLAQEDCSDFGILFEEERERSNRRRLDARSSDVFTSRTAKRATQDDRQVRHIIGSNNIEPPCADASTVG